MRIGIIGYGNLGKGVEAAVCSCPDMELAAVFTRRNPDGIHIRTEGVPVRSYIDIKEMADEIDVMILCCGSATDLPEMTAEIAKTFHVVDSFDTHANIPAHFTRVDTAAQTGGTVAIISVGWDPGLFSLNRLYANAILPNGHDYTFWGKGVSQGHSDAVRHIPGVKDARQYTIPVSETLHQVCNGESPCLTLREKHMRECFVVAEQDADLQGIEMAIRTMPNYFADYDTRIIFIDQEEMERSHGALPHGGSVIRNGVTGWAGETKHTIEYKLTLASNPEFTSSVLVAYARAAYRMAQLGRTGCHTVFDVPPATLSLLSREELLKVML